MFAFLLNPGGRKAKRRRRRSRGRRMKVCYTRRSSRRSRRGRKAKKYGRRRSSRRSRRWSSTTARRMWHGRASPALRASRAAYAAEQADRLPSASERGYRSVANNGKRRRRSRRRNTTWVPQFATNPYWAPQFAMNPSGVLRSVKSGFNLKLLTGAVPVAVGFFGNMALASTVSSYLPSMLQGNLGQALVGAATAGLLGFAVHFVSPRHAVPVAFGGVLEVMVSTIRQYIMPVVSHATSGIADYITRGDAAAARSLGCMNGGCGGMGLVNASYVAGNWVTGRTPQSFAAMNPFELGSDFTQPITPEDLTPQLDYAQQGLEGFGDYLTVQNAANARPLGYLGHTGNDFAIEGTATDELGS